VKKGIRKAREERFRRFDRKWSFFDGVRSCKGREKWLLRLSPFSVLSLRLTLSLLLLSLSLSFFLPTYFSISAPKGGCRNVSLGGSLWSNPESGVG